MSDTNVFDNPRPDRFAAVILAAGYSSRMKAFKPLLDVGRMTAAERLIKAVGAAGIEKIAVVTGYNRERLGFIFGSGENPEAVHNSAQQDIIEVYNGNFPEGMFSSIRAGLAAAAERWPEAEGIFLMPVDCPLISSEVLIRLMQSARRSSAGSGMQSAGLFHVPVFEGKKGHPLLIPSSYTEEICEHDGTGGLKAITDKHRDRMIRVPVEEEGCLLDMDTPEGYDEIKRFLKDGCRRVPLEHAAAGRRIFLVRHGETMRHDEKMFIGRYDVPLDDGAEPEIRKMAGELISELTAAGRIYTSPLLRAVQTAEIIKSEMPEAQDTELCIVRDFQEISLGDWDGRPVREIAEMYPEDYAARGRDLFAFKTGNKAENFYDVQYRAVKALRRILEEDDSRDIVIVTHSAVIRALENNLRGLRVDDDWQAVQKCSFVIAPE